MEPSNVDGIMYNHPTTTASNAPAEQAEAPVSPPETLADFQSTNGNEQTAEDHVAQDAVEPEEEVLRETSERETPEDEPEPKKAEEADEYGNPIKPPRVYTEEEVNQMMRERFSRSKLQQQQPEPLQPPSQQAQPEEGAEAWDAQLEEYIAKTIDKRERKRSEIQWQEQERQRQEVFEDKFRSGMAKYQDFQNVVQGKPITDQMLLAARSLDNPAAFIYGAAKMHSQELDRISKINDPFTQAAEVGRLHERMVKQARMVSKAPKPIEAPKGDVSQKNVSRQSIDARIEQHARQKQNRK